MSTTSVDQPQATEQPPIEGTAVEVEPQPMAQALELRSQELAVTPSATAEDLVARMDVIKQAAASAMVKDVDYGVIPGTNKPALLKPGAEKLGALFQLDVQFSDEQRWGPGDHLTVVSTAIVYHAPTGTRLGSGKGVCSTREKKYGRRQAKRTCPACGAAAIIKGKDEYGGGWLCFKKQDGCGAKYPDGDQQIEAQQVGEIENPDLADTWNTVTKMAHKRARIDAVLAATGASAVFTQDVEEQHTPDDDVVPAEPAAAPVPLAGGDQVQRLVDRLKTVFGEGDQMTAAYKALLAVTRGADYVPLNGEGKVALAALQADTAIAVLEAVAAGHGTASAGNTPGWARPADEVAQRAFYACLTKVVQAALPQATLEQGEAIDPQQVAAGLFRRLKGECGDTVPQLLVLTFEQLALRLAAADSFEPTAAGAQS